MPGQDPSRDYDLLDRLVEEFNDRFRRGERPSVREYCDRYPELADDLRELLPAAARVEHAKDVLAAEPPPPPPPAAVPQMGDFHILREVGRGGMGLVYEAEQVSLGRRVALKVLTQRMMRDEKQRRRFEREAKAAARLHHTNIVPVHGYGEHDGTPYYVMQFIHGMGLDAVIDELSGIAPSGNNPPAEGAPGRRGPVSAIAQSLLTGEFHHADDRPDGPPDQLAATRTQVVAAAGLDQLPPAADSDTSTVRASGASGVTSSVTLPGQSAGGRKSRRLSYWQSVAQVGVQVADALAYAHGQGVVHRDIKPSNLLLDLQGTVWVADFGLAKADGAENLTHTGDVLGTLRYMPPEAFEGRSDARGDVYSLGLTLYELAALRPAFDEKDRNRLIKQVTTAEPEPLGRVRKGVPRDLETLVRKATDRDPARRYQTAAELRDDLQRFVDDEPIRARRQSGWESGRRWCRHHPAVASLLGLLALLLVGVTVASLAAAAHFTRLARNEANAAANERKARQEAEDAKRVAEAAEQQAREAGEREAKLRKDAEAAKALAETNFGKARAAVDDYLTRVSENQLLQVPGLEDLRKELLLSALAFYQQFLKDRGDDPSIRAGLAEAHLRVAKIQTELGTPNKSNAYLQAQRLFQELLKADPNNAEYLHGLAETYFGQGRYDAAIAVWAKLVRPELARFQAELARAHAAKASGFGNTGKIPEALAAHQEAQAIQERLVTLAPNNPAYRRDLGATLNNIGILLGRNPKFGGEALLMYRRAAEHVREAHARTPYDLTTGRFLAIILRNVASQLRSTGGDDEAVKAYAEAVGLWRKLAFEHPNVPELHVQLYTLSLELSRYQGQLGKTGEAEQSLFQARAAIARLPKDGAANLFLLACVHALTAEAISREKGKLSAAEEAERRKETDLAVGFLKQAVAAGYRTSSLLTNHPDLRAIQDRADFKALAAEVERQATADKTRSDSIAKLQAAVREATATTLSDTATAEEKEVAHRTLLGLRVELDKLLPRYDAKADQAASKQAIALVELDQGNVDAAAKLLREAVALREEMLKQYPTHPLYQADLISARVAQGKLHWATGRRSEAVRAWEQGLADLEALAVKHPAHRDILARWAGASLTVADTYFQLGLVDEAAAHYERVFQKYQPVEVSWWRSHALHRLMAGDTDGHRKACEEVAKRFVIRPGTWEAHHLTTLWSMAPPAGSHDPETMREYSLAFAQADPTNDWKRFYHGLVLYRLGRFEEARSWVDLNWAQSLPVRAMIAHRLGQKDEARKWLAEADARYRTELRTGLREPAWTFMQGAAAYDQDRTQFLILRNEARLLIEGKPAAPDELTSLYRARGYARLGDAVKAEAGFAAAVRVRPNDPSVWALRGRVYADLGRDGAGVADLVKARKLADELLAGKIADDDLAGAAEYLETLVPAPGWVPLRPSSAASEAKGELVVRPDGSVEPPGPLSGDDVYTLVVPTERNGITALRLDVFPTDEKVGGVGSVRLVEFTLAAAPRGGEAKPVPVSRVVGAPKFAAGDGPAAGWSSELDPVRFHSVVLLPEHPVGGAEGSTLTVRMRLRGPKDATPLGRIQLRVAQVSGPDLKGLETPGPAGDGRTVRGRFVRVQVPGPSRILNLAEVEVMSGGKNVARGGRATQSSTGWGGVASRGIDGNTSGLYSANGQFHTAEEANPWWEVDLGAEYLIDQVRLYNRTEEGGIHLPRIAGYTLRVLDASRREVFSLPDQPAPQATAVHVMRSDAFALPGAAPDPEFARLAAGPARDRAFLAATLARSGRLPASAEMFGRAVATADTPAAAQTVYQYAATFDAVFPELAKLRPNDLALWLARGRRRAEEGRNAEADEAFAAAAKLTPNELHRFLDGGWWAVGPYPGDPNVPCPPEKFADPSKPVAAAAGPGEFSWQRVPFAQSNGGVATDQVLTLTPTDSAYALAYVFSPDDRATTLTVISAGPARVWLNGRLVFSGSARDSFRWAYGATATPIALRKGRNQLLVRVSGAGAQAPAFHARLGDHPAERGVQAVRAGLWTEAESAYAEVTKRVPDDLLMWRVHTHMLWAAGKPVEARAELDRRLRQHQVATQWRIAADVLQVAALFPEKRADATRLADVLKAHLDATPARPNWLVQQTGWAYLAVGKWDAAAKLLEEALAQDGGSGAIWPGLALAYHHLGQRDKAVNLVRKTEERLARKIAEKLEHPDLDLPWDSHNQALLLAHLDQARAALDLKPGPDPDFASLQAKHRKLLAARDPATAAFDYALLRAPKEPLGWVAIGLRLGELDRWADARKAFDKATELAPDDPQVWKARGQAHAALRKWDAAAADFVKAVELVPVGSVSYGRDDAGVHSAAAAEDEVFVRVAKALPKDTGLWARRFRRFAEAGDWKRAAAALDDEPEPILATSFETGYFRAALAARLGDPEGYRKRCEALLKRATGSGDLWVARHTAAACLLLPDAVPDIKAILPLAERLVAGTEKSPHRASFVRFRALAAYRTGDFAGAVTWLLRTPEASDGIGGVEWRALRAMAEHRLGKPDTARDWLGKAHTAFADRPRPDRGQSFGSQWETWVSGELLLSEAEALIERKPTGPGEKK